jgi:hypothetical protein
MLLFLLVFLTALLMWYITRAIQLEANLPNSFIVLPLVVCILVTGVFEFRWSSGENKGAHLVSYISGVSNSNLECQGLFGALYDTNPLKKGYVDESDPKTVHLKYIECMELVHWFNADSATEPATSHQAFALHLLIFEAAKVGTDIDGLEAECNATARYVEVAEYGGATSAEATRMLDMYKSDWYPYIADELKQPCP